MPEQTELNFQHTYQALGDEFTQPQSPSAASHPALIITNNPLAQALEIPPGLLTSESALHWLSGNTIPANARPSASVYAGHQFGHWNPQLGDGRAILLGELQGLDGTLYDVQLKGAGHTPFSRGGDGRSPLGPVLREYLVSEAMHALGIGTTRALAAVTTGDYVYRHNGRQPGAILTRVARSHIRVGTFEFFASHNNIEAVKKLADYVIDRHYPKFIAEHFANNPYEGLLVATINSQAKLIAQWMSLGFIHGVMNTDNMLVCGDTVDYGPCAFIDQFRKDQVFSSIDTGGRYAYSNQPGIGQWNLTWFAQSLLPLLADQQEAAIAIAQAQLNLFGEKYQAQYDQLFAKKIGFSNSSTAVSSLVSDWLTQLERDHGDFTTSFRNLANCLIAQTGLNLPLESGVPGTEPDQKWINQWLDELKNMQIDVATAVNTIRCANPMVIPRNHRIQEAITAATERNDYRPFENLHRALAQPFNTVEHLRDLIQPPEHSEKVLRTFCGT